MKAKTLIRLAALTLLSATTFADSTVTITQYGRDAQGRIVTHTFDPFPKHPGAGLSAEEMQAKLAEQFEAGRSAGIKETMQTLQAYGFVKRDAKTSALDFVKACPRCKKDISPAWRLKEKRSESK